MRIPSADRHDPGRCRSDRCALALLSCYSLAITYAGEWLGVKGFVPGHKGNPKTEEIAHMATPTAQKIMIIRHAEKPSGIGALYGVNDSGELDAEALIVTRMAESRRARGLVRTNLWSAAERETCDASLPFRSGGRKAREERTPHRNDYAIERKAECLDFRGIHQRSRN
jgi:hypothetical protein